MRRVEDVIEVYGVNPDTGELSVKDVIPDHEENRRLSNEVIDIDGVTSRHQLEDWMSRCINRSSLVKDNDLIKKHNEACGWSVRSGEKELMTLKQYLVLKELIKHVVYRNIVIMKRAELCEKLGVVNQHLVRKLNTAKPYVKVTTKGMSVGYVKIEISPVIVWVYESWGFVASRDNAVLKWWKDSQNESVKDPTKRIEKVLAPTPTPTTTSSVKEFLGAHRPDILHKMENNLPLHTVDAKPIKQVGEIYNPTVENNETAFETSEGFDEWVETIFKNSVEKKNTQIED